MVILGLRALPLKACQKKQEIQAVVFMK